MLRLFALASALALCLLAARAAEPTEWWRGWSAFESVNVRELAKGKIATSTNGSMNFDRGMSCQALFLVNAPLETTHEALLKFNATRHPELEVFQHHVFHGEKDSGFDRLVLNAKDKATAALLRSMSDPGEFQLSTRERAQLPRAPHADAARQFLSAILRERWSRFANAGDFGSVGTHDAASEIRSVLAEEGKMSRRFAPLLGPVRTKGALGAPAYFYWDQSVVDGKTAVQLGVAYDEPLPEGRQMLDITYFSSRSFLVAFSFYEMHPLTLDGRAQTLVWQGSLVSTTAIAGALGFKRKIGARVMLSDVEKWIRLFRQEAQSGVR